MIMDLQEWEIRPKWKRKRLYWICSIDHIEVEKKWILNWILLAKYKKKLWNVKKKIRESLEET